LIVRKIITIVATRGQILMLKFAKFYFGWALEELTAGFKGPTSKGRERRGAEGKEGKGRGGEVKGVEEMYSSTTCF